MMFQIEWAAMAIFYFDTQPARFRFCFCKWWWWSRKASRRAASKSIYPLAGWLVAGYAPLPLPLPSPQPMREPNSECSLPLGPNTFCLPARSNPSSARTAREKLDSFTIINHVVCLADLLLFQNVSSGAERPSLAGSGLSSPSASVRWPRKSLGRSAESIHATYAMPAKSIRLAGLANDNDNNLNSAQVGRVAAARWLPQRVAIDRRPARGQISRSFRPARAIINWPSPSRWPVAGEPA